MGPRTTLSPSDSYSSLTQFKRPAFAFRLFVLTLLAVSLHTPAFAQKAVDFSELGSSSVSSGSRSPVGSPASPGPQLAPEMPRSTYEVNRPGPAPSASSAPSIPIRGSQPVAGRSTPTTGVTEVPRFGKATTDVSEPRGGFEQRPKREPSQGDLKATRAAEALGRARAQARGFGGEMPPQISVPQPGNDQPPIEQPREAQPSQPASPAASRMSLPRYRGGAPPISFTVASTGERHTLAPGSVGEGVERVQGVQIPRDIYDSIQEITEKIHQGQWDEALSQGQEAVSQHDGNPHLWALLGEIHLAKHQYADAASAYGEAAHLWPSRFRSRYIETLLLSQQDNKAVPMLVEEIQQRPKDAHLLYTLGTVYLTRNNPEKALPCLKRAVALNPDSSDIHFNLGLAYEKLGQVDQARSQYQQALELSPIAEDASEGLSRLEALNAMSKGPQSLRPSLQEEQTAPLASGLPTSL